MRPGLIILTDEFLSYTGLQNSDEYRHQTVCHKYHFVCLETGVHTQHVESCNNKLKSAIKKCKGLTQEGRSMILLEVMFFNHHKENAFNLICISMKYDFLNN